ncbi:cyanoexosortase B system-associated protein [Leptothoe sp. PORK10 BA2]|uniref:cyanoexosortase B system-associated protein n=1 Tax=Leptothoe sp. PORK10 BA2 TaxID=3110254 RepID=UPI002B21C418|nr:cyanoexosortase B system-associated protein [Leptothoe sp. PORK10 BA2]MEA5462237.1 cyanoexosortase B system-associated protein [Leptothoe sp. PORK10 BA2]
MAVSFDSSDSKSNSWLRWLVVIVLAVMVAVAAIPQYFSGHFPWQSPPSVANLETIRSLKDTGLSLDGWSEDLQQKISIGGDQWSVQQLTHANGPVPEQMIIFLKPQGLAKDQPEVEWIDLQGAQKWQTSHHRRLRLGTLHIDTFRAWTSSQTFAVSQWYALPQGGHPAPHHWFWQDQRYQWRRSERLPWVAVAVMVPMPPLGDITPVYPQLERLSQLVQTTLVEAVFSPESP